MAAQFTAMSFPVRPDSAWMAPANTSLPTPVSPRSRISESERARRRSLEMVSASAGESVATGVSGAAASSLTAASSAAV